MNDELTEISYRYSFNVEEDESPSRDEQGHMTWQMVTLVVLIIEYGEESKGNMGLFMRKPVRKSGHDLPEKSIREAKKLLLEWFRRWSLENQKAFQKLQNEMLHNLEQGEY